MEEVPFQDWPVDVLEEAGGGGHSWTPAYGLQTPSALLEKEDFIGNPDAEYFFQGSSFSSSYSYLETIQEETSDDLVSSHGSSYSDSHCHSPAGWLATDSDSGSVVCVENNEDCDSDRELACPAKRRKQDTTISKNSQETVLQPPQVAPLSVNHLSVPEEESETSLSRSSSLLQFETLEKQCQLDPPQSLTLSFDSLELNKVSDSSQTTSSRDSLLYKSNRSKSDSGESTSSSDTATLEESKFVDSRSLDNLRTWRSFGSLPQLSGGGARRFSSENLSEDSGFGDQISSKTAGSVGSLKKETTTFGAQESEMQRKRNQKNSYVGFNAYDGDFFQNFTGNFGVSYQDLTTLDRYEATAREEEYHVGKNSPLTDRFLHRLRQRQQKQQQAVAVDDSYTYAINFHALLKLDRASVQQSNFIQKNVSLAASVPDLNQSSASAETDVKFASNSVFSVPKDLNFITDLQQLSPVTSSVAEKNLNLADCIRFDFVDGKSQTSRNLDEEFLNKKQILEDMAAYRQNREGSYTRAMDNRVDLSDDENSLCYKKKLKLPNNPIVEFDKRVLKAISEQSLQSLRGSQNVLDNYTQYEEPSPPRQKRKIGYSATISTPDLNRTGPSRMRHQEYYDNERTKSNLEISKVDELAMLEIAKLDKIIKDEQKLIKNEQQKRNVLDDTPKRKLETNVDDVFADHKANENVASQTYSKREKDKIKNDIGSGNSEIENEETDCASNKNDAESCSTPKTKVVEVSEDTNKIKKERKEDVVVYLDRLAKDRIIPNVDRVVVRDTKFENTYVERDALADDDEFKNHRNSLLEVGSLPVIQELKERKGSIIKSSTSTSGMSDVETDRTLRNSVKSFTGSTGSKGVHFSPVVAEVKWHDDDTISSVTSERESSYSLNSSPSPEPTRKHSKLVKPRPRYAPTENSRRSVSQPDLSEAEDILYRQEFIDSLHNLRQQDLNLSKSQPEISKHHRRGSQMIKKDSDGCTIKAIVELDGVQYKHTHLTTSGGNLAQPNEQQPASSAHQHEQSKNSMGTNRTHASDADVARTSTGDVVGAKKKGLGGFLQRLASFRLGARKSRDHHNKNKRKAAAPAVATSHQVLHSGNGALLSAPNDMSTAKPNYIYIPLKGPPSSNNNNYVNENPSQTVTKNGISKTGESENLSGCGPASGKPPLPRQPPPRVVHASAKRAVDSRAPALERGQYPTPPHLTEREDGVAGRQLDAARHTRRGKSNGAAATLSRARGDDDVDCRSMETPMGLIETDLDTEVTVITNAKAISLLNLGEPRLSLPPDQGSSQGGRRPHKSMEFLLDKENLKVVEPPENELQKTERVMSEHELRVQRSLQKLTIPDWYKQNQVPQQGFLLKKHSPRDTRWTGTGSKTTSLSSLGSPQVLSPTPSLQQPFVRWSTSKLNSTASSPCQSTRSSFNQGRHQNATNGAVSPCSSARSSFSYRQPYLGWRSQERLNRTPRTPAERLASSLLAHQHTQNHHSNHQQESPEIQTSIKEVTSAIVHYVKGLKPHDPDLDRLDNSRSNSVSPRGSQKFCWLESSFVGTKPVDSPETPLTCSESHVPPSLSQNSRLELLQNRQSNSGKSVVRAS